MTSFVNVSNNSDTNTNDVRRSLASRLNSSKRKQESFDSGLHLADDAYRWRNCNQEIRNWLKEKDKELRQKKREERQLAKKEEEKAEQEKEMIEAQKLESREKVRTWLDQRRKKIKNTPGSPSKKVLAVESINSASKEIVNYENTSLKKAPTEIDPDEFKLDSLEISRQISSEKTAEEANAVGKQDEEIFNFNEEHPWRETCSKEDTGNETNNSDNKNEPDGNEPHTSDFEKLLAGFTNSNEQQDSKENHQVQQKIDKDADVSSLKDANEALIKHEIDLNQNGMVNEWLYDSGRLFEDSNTSEPAALQDTNERIESPKSPERMTTFLDQNVNESRKSIKITHFDLLRDQTESGSQNGEKIDLEQFKRLIIHDDNDPKNNFNNKNFDSGNNDNRDTSDRRRRRSFRRTSTAMESEDEKLSEKVDEKNLAKLKRNFLKFDDSYRSPKKDVPAGVLFDDSPSNADLQSSLDGRPKTSRRRVQIEKKREIVFE